MLVHVTSWAPVFGWVKSHVGSLPAPMSLAYFWGFGSLLGVTLGLQIGTGFLLSINYGQGADPFAVGVEAARETFFGCCLRWAHLNLASGFFVLIYAHVFRGLYKLSYRLPGPWLSGTGLLVLLMGTAFLGYVLPWGQMSLWGATVITNLLSSIPVLGPPLVLWVWGGYSVSASYTLGVFYSCHFLFPFILAGGATLHMVLLHESGSSSRLGIHSKEHVTSFHSAYTLKDVAGASVGVLLWACVLLSPWYLSDAENFAPANPLSSPPHIQPEWYFLFAYAILRAVPSKAAGVFALAMSVSALLILPYNARRPPLLYATTLIVTSFFFVATVLTWAGSKPVEAPYDSLARLFTCAYFGHLGALLFW